MTTLVDRQRTSPIPWWRWLTGFAALSIIGVWYPVPVAILTLIAVVVVLVRPQVQFRRRGVIVVGLGVLAVCAFALVMQPAGTTTQHLDLGPIRSCSAQC